jgi:hypothetical protein
MAPRYMSKKEYSERSGIPERTLRNFLNNRYYERLKELDYNKRQRKLTPKQVSFLDNLLCVYDYE